MVGVPVVADQCGIGNVVDVDVARFFFGGLSHQNVDDIVRIYFGFLVHLIFLL